MSTAKRSRRRQTDARAASPLPASKRLKIAKTSHVPTKQGLDFLINDEERDGRRLEGRLTNGTPTSKATRVDESRAVVAPDVRDFDQVGASQQTAIDISSAEEESSSDESEDEQEESVRKMAVINGGAHTQPTISGNVSKVDGEKRTDEQAVAGAEDVDMVDPGFEAEDAEEPSFGDLLQARHPEPIDVQASLSHLSTDQHALVPTNGEYALSAPSGATLRTVLTQALKTNDRDLMERCFQTTDLNDIRATIERLQSQHVATLLQRLAERIHKRPGRTGTLVTWIQWSLVAHGAYLASQPEVMKRLRSLAQVLRERANGLQPLLRLKGKLDMLSAQLELRQRMQAASRAANADDDEVDEGVVYVEGQDDDWSSDEDEGVEKSAAANTRYTENSIPKSKGQTATPRNDVDESSSDSDGEIDMPNGVAQEVDDETSEDEDEEGGLLDMEAEETSDDDAEEDSEEDSAESRAESEDESESSDAESEPGVRPAKPGVLNRKR